jgi:hypothetical protein
LKKKITQHPGRAMEAAKALMAERDTLEAALASAVDQLAQVKARCPHHQRRFPPAPAPRKPA